MSGWMYVSI